MLNNLGLRSCARSRSGQRSQGSVFTFWGPGWVRRAAKSSRSSKVKGKFLERYCMRMKGILEKVKVNVRSQTKGHYKIQLTNMLCDTCFLGHFASRYRWRQSFDPIKSSSLTFDGDHVVSSNFPTNIFA